MIRNDESYCIGIITYSKRKNYIETLLCDIREQSDIPVYLAVNCDYNQPFDNDYRKFILELSTKYDNVYPSFYLKFRGSSKLWNDIITNSNYDNILMLNDDGRVKNNFINDIINYKITTKNNTILKTNHGWASFIVTKRFIQSVGFFNEFYIGIGFEDYEFVKRVGEFPSFNSPDWVDLELESKQTFPGNENKLEDSLKSYSSFNYTLFNSRYHEFTKPECNFRPFEEFYNDNFDKIFEFTYI